MTLSFEGIVSGLVAQGIPRERAESVARREIGVPVQPTHEGPTLAQEKAVEHAGDRLMRAHGFTVIRFSQPRATKQTAGIPDRRYYRPPRIVEREGARFMDSLHGYALWWEAKTSEGKQSPAQKVFQELVEACGETYLVGTDAVLCEYLRANGWVIP